MSAVDGRPFVQGQEARGRAEVDRALTLIRCLAPFSGDAWLTQPRKRAARLIPGGPDPTSTATQPAWMRIPMPRRPSRAEGVSRRVRPVQRGHL